MFTNTSSGHLPLLESWSERLRCFCHKKTIDMGYICSVCLSIFCKHHKKCSTCGSLRWGREFVSILFS
ncbi:hypothetical protein RGQ29_013821 [Quercus rubra]|uniref:General transcription and DNA repair factor IIH subunit TFB4 n=1 Tax=Quercus rubra TaxID=3512 RepID=A0AAN7FKB6_QUERU|nr:hypothetical protein RGQ29_013821 [Quercus rubra]